MALALVLEPCNPRPPPSTLALIFLDASPPIPAVYQHYRLWRLLLDCLTRTKIT